LEGKGIRLRLPERQEDISPQRVRVDTGQEYQDVPLVIDRVASTWRVAELEQALLSGGVFETFTARENDRHPVPPGEDRMVLGYARSVAQPGEPVLMMEYALIDLEDEMLVARYIGEEEQMAFNTSVIRGSLASLEAAPLLTGEIAGPIRVAWAPRPFPSPGAPHLNLPAGWLIEEGAPFPCEGLPVPDSVLLASPVGDFTVSFLAAWWRAGPATREAARACSREQGSLGETSYASVADYLGLSYQIEGIFVEREDGLLQLEVVVPLEKYGFVSDAFKGWVSLNAGPGEH
jgi:hypothetical protein